MNEGVVPFRYGFAGDYWPGIDLAHGSTLGVSKDMYVSSRSEVARKRLEEVEERALELADGRTERAIRKEREYIVGRISISAADTLASARAQAMQGRLAAPHGKGGKSKKGPAAYASPQRASPAKKGGLGKTVSALPQLGGKSGAAGANRAGHGLHSFGPGR